MCLYRGRTVTVDNRVRYVALIALGDRHCVYVFGLSPEPSYSQLSRDLFRPRGKKVMLGEAVAQDVLDGWDIAAVENKFWEEEHKGAASHNSKRVKSAAEHTAKRVKSASESDFRVKELEAKLAASEGQRQAQAKKGELKATKAALATKTTEYEAKMLKCKKKREKLDNKRDRLKRLVAELTQASDREIAKDYERGIDDFKSALKNSVTNDRFSDWVGERQRFHECLEDKKRTLLSGKAHSTS